MARAKTTLTIGEKFHRDGATLTVTGFNSTTVFINKEVDGEVHSISYPLSYFKKLFLK